jgi:CheY-like chemotaxis protein
MNKKTVMFIDDDKEEIEIFIDFVSKCSIPVEVLYATDALEGIAVMKSRNDIDVIFLDVNMPRLSGFDIVKRIKADEQLSRIPIIVMSSGTNAYNEHKAILSGAFSFMIKSSKYQNYCIQLQKAIESLAS